MEKTVEERVDELLKTSTNKQMLQYDPSHLMGYGLIALAMITLVRYKNSQKESK